MGGRVRAEDGRQAEGGENERTEWRTELRAQSMAGSMTED
jgi:hypothetical protein